MGSFWAFGWLCGRGVNRRDPIGDIVHDRMRPWGGRVHNELRISRSGSQEVAVDARAAHDE